MAKEVSMEFAFFEFLRSFYLDNKGIIRNRYREITKKYLSTMSSVLSSSFLNTDEYKKLMDKATDYLKTNYPDWEDPTKYWD